MKDGMVLTGLIAVFGVTMFYIGIQAGRSENKCPRNEVTIVWNDDLEGIPADGEMVEIQETVNDTIYIGSID